MIEATSSAGEQALNQLLADPQVEEVMINGPHKAFVIANGRKAAHELAFRMTRNCGR